MRKHIFSAQNERIKQAARLRDRRGRQQQGRIIVDGCREVRRALEADVRPLEVFVSDSHLHDPQIQAVTALLEPGEVEPTPVAQHVFDKIAFGNRSEGIVLIAAEPQLCLHQLQLPEDALICILEGVEKPGNLGAVVRTADAAGLAAVIVTGGGTDLYNHNAIRASMGAVFGMPLCAASPAEVLAWLRDQRLAVFAARVGAGTHYARVDYRGRSALLLGSEAEGLSNIWVGDEITDVGLPMLGIVDSLNVAATAAVLCYEALRQRQA